MQEQNKAILSRLDQMKTERKDLLSAYTKAVRMRDREALHDAMEDIKDFNRTNGNPLFMISMGNIASSLRGAISEARYDVQGMGLNRNESYYAEKLVGK